MKGQAAIAGATFCRLKITCFVAVVFLANPAFAEDCPPTPDHAEALADLIDKTRNAPDEATARSFNDDMWAIWLDAPDKQAQDWLDEAMLRRQAFDYDGAMIAADALVDYCPDYAEGYNQRAFLNFLKQDYEAALPDLDRAIALVPEHLGALTGQALTYAALERNAEAALVLRRALELNPWLSERHMLPALEAEEEEL